MRNHVLIRRYTPILTALSLVLANAVRLEAQLRAPTRDSLPSYLRDRGTGVPMSMFGTYVRRGELLVYPFLEWDTDLNLEYSPKELGYTGNDAESRGLFQGSERLLWLAYGLTKNVAIELEGAYLATGDLTKSTSDPSSKPGEIFERGLGDVEGQVRWRWHEESARRPEAFTYFETVFPFQRKRKIIGTQNWEFGLGTGVTKGYSWGTLTARAGVEYAREDGKIDVGEYAVEYLRRLSSALRVVGIVEGSQLDEVSLITEAQWHLNGRVFLKANNGWGLTPNATTYAPEIGLMISF